MLYVVRHGETEWNALNKVLGRTDIPLNAAGVKQAREAAHSMKDFKIDEVLSSPLLRTRQTAEIISDELGIGFSTDERLIEQEFGMFEGVDRFDEGYQKAKRKNCAGYHGVESYADMTARVYPLLKEKEGKDVLLVTHGGVCRIIRSCFEDMSSEEFVQFSQENCELRVYSISDLRDITKEEWLQNGGRSG